MINYVLAPNPVLQFTDNLGNYVPYGKIRTLDWDTRQPKPTYFDPAGLKARPNPFPLDSIGRAFEVYWEDQGAYYLELIDRNGIRVWFTAEPFIPPGGGGGNITIATQETNLFLNGQMRFFPVQKYEPIPNNLDINVADGGWQFVKEGTNLNDLLQFVKFTADNTDVDASPTYYLNYVSNDAAIDETRKDLLYSLNDVRTLSNEQITVAAAIRSAIAGTYEIEVYAFQFFGTATPDVTPSPPVLTLLATWTPTTAWENFTTTAILPSLVGKTIGELGDDNLTILFRMPLNSVANLEMVNFYLKRGTAANAYPYLSYEEVDAEIKAYQLPRFNPDTDFPNRTANQIDYSDQAYDVLSLKPNNNVLTEAWMPPIPIGTALLWPSDVVPDGFVSGEGQILVVSGKYNRLFHVPFSNGVFGTAYGAVLSDTIQPSGWGDGTYFNLSSSDIGYAAEAYSSGNTGFEIVRNAPGHPNTEIELFDNSAPTYTFLNTQNGNVGTVVSSDTSIPIEILNNGSPTEKGEWKFTGLPATSIAASTYIAYNTPTGDFYIYFIKDGSGVDPALPGRSGYPCEIETIYDAEEVAACILRAILGYESNTFHALPGAALLPADYFIAASTTGVYQFYYRIDGSTNIPENILGILVPVEILSTDTAEEVATRTIEVFEPLLFRMPDNRGQFMRIWAHGSAVDPDRNLRTNRGDGTTGDFPGTFQGFQIEAHQHTTGNGEEFYTSNPEGTTFLAEGPENDLQYEFDPLTSTTGGNETRPVNVYFNLIYKY